ncbi:Helix-turn-helix [Nitrosomonas aestuarii]|uniref:Helix-turn-helix n=1 Tax=Nitrosomonas aestuarii TaxID=52441 RepID=A0A1I4DJP7_9PROT|nr:helix-turn-helix domain-containing protein [Nitrosomonas aestuarii]SFK93139.1 Helix-turn-helix [Nitrosomonas aestuarii]
MNKQKDSKEKQQKESASDSTFFSDYEKKVNQRIKEAIGDEPVKAFSRRCGVPDTSLRDYISGKKKPGLDAITAISSFTGITVDWLATGRGIKYTRDLKYAEERLRGAPPAVLPELPEELEPYRKRLDALLTYLSMIDDDEERSQIIDSFVLRAQDKVDLDPLKDYFTKMKANNTK